MKAIFVYEYSLAALHTIGNAVDLHQHFSVGQKSELHLLVPVQIAVAAPFGHDLLRRNDIHAYRKSCILI